jgi:hypothetical protein
MLAVMMQRGGMLWFVSPYELEVRRSADRGRWERMCISLNLDSIFNGSLAVS